MSSDDPHTPPRTGQVPQVPHGTGQHTQVPHGTGQHTQVPHGTGQHPQAPDAAGQALHLPPPGGLSSALGVPGVGAGADAATRPAAAPAPSPVLHATAATTAADAAATAADAAASAAVAVALPAVAEPQPAAAEARARISAMPPAGPPDAGAADPSDGRPARSWVTSRSGLDRLRIGGHVATRSALDGLGFAATPRGLRIGLDRDGHPVTVRPFRPEPTRITLVGGSWAAQVLVFRMLAVGASAVVVTPTPQPWESFGAWVGGDRSRLRVAPPDQPFDPGQPFDVDAGPYRPTLIVDETGALGGVRPPGPWQTLLSVVPRLTGGARDLIAGADLVALQRLTPDEAAVVTGALRLTKDTGALLQMLEPDMFALLGGGANRYVWVTVTPTEGDRFGAPRR